MLRSGVFAWQTVGGARRAVTTLLLMIAVPLAVAACGGQSSQMAHGSPGAPTATATVTATATPAPTATPRPTATPAPFTGRILRVAKTVPWLTGAVSVSCPAGTTLVGGGVDNGYGTTNLAQVESSYPSSASTWRILGPASNVSYNLTAVADCLESSTPITTHIYKVSTPSSTYLVAPGAPVEIFTPRCPFGVAVGGGYDANGQGGAYDAHPNGATGWMFTTNYFGMTAYVICATGRLNVKQFNATASYPKYSGTGPALVVESTVGCPAGYLLLSGGFGQPKSSDVQVGWGSNELGASGSRWVVTGANGSGSAVRTGYVYALCVQVA